MPLSDIFKSKQELEAEQKKAQRRELRDATRSCDRVQSDLDRQAKELEIQIKAAAKKNDKDLVNVLAKQLVKVRNQKVRATGAKSKISNVASHASTIETSNKLAGVMASSAAVISKMNQHLKPEQLAETLGQFQAETTKMDMKEDAMNDMFDDLFEENDEEADAIMNQVLDELSLETGEKLSTLPSTSSKLPIGHQEAARTTGKTTSIRQNTSNH